MKTGRLLLLSVLLTTLGVLGQTSSFAQTYFYLDEVSISPADPAPGEDICITVSGTKSTPCVYVEYMEVYSLGGTDLALDMCFYDTSICIQILQPWDTTFCIPGFPAGDYVMQFDGCNYSGIGQTLGFTVSGMAAPQSLFAPDPQQGCAPLEVFFLNQSSNADTYEWDFGDGNSSTEESPTHIFTESGSYAITLTATNSSSGQSDVETFNLLVFPLPTVALGADTSLTTTQNLLLNAGAGFTTYLWSDGSTNAFLQIDGTQLSPGTYTYSVTVTNSQGCEGSDEIVVTITEPSGVLGPHTPLSFHIYPNPAKEFIRLETQAPIQHIQWLDLNGRVISEETFDRATPVIRVPDVPDGMYLLKAITEQFAYGVLVEIQQ